MLLVFVACVFGDFFTPWNHPTQRILEAQNALMENLTDGRLMSKYALAVAESFLREHFGLNLSSIHLKQTEKGVIRRYKEKKTLWENFHFHIDSSLNATHGKLQDVFNGSVALNIATVTFNVWYAIEHPTSQPLMLFSTPELQSCELCREGTKFRFEFGPILEQVLFNPIWVSNLDIFTPFISEVEIFLLLIMVM
jgi:hypothetical protein